MKAVNDVKVTCYRIQIIKKKFITQQATNITTNNMTDDYTQYQAQDLCSTQIITKKRVTKPIVIINYRIQLFL